jgi:hypothetical protein
VGRRVGNCVERFCNQYGAHVGVRHFTGDQMKAHCGDGAEKVSDGCHQVILR